jgi:hypothetical protein
VAELTVLYDEGCDFCTRLAARLAGRPEITAAPTGSTTGSLMPHDLSPAERTPPCTSSTRSAKRSGTTH